MTNDTALRQALRAAQALATCCMAPGCYSHDELVEMARATKPTIDAALASPAPAQPDDVVERVRGEGRDEGATFVLEALAKALGGVDWHIHDGSDTWDGDVHATMMSILYTSGAIDEEDHSTAMQKLSAIQPAIDEMREVLASFAVAADDLDENHHEKADIWEAPAALNITAGDLRRAAALHQKLTEAK